MSVVAARLDELDLRLVAPFETSFGVQRSRRVLMVQLLDSEGRVGFGECVAARDPGYSSETVATARWAVGDLLLPLVFRGAGRPETFVRATARIRGHSMARAAVEMALWDLEGRRLRRSLRRLLGGSRTRVEVGVSVGIQPSVPQLVRTVGEYLSAGYLRIKLKVRPGWDRRPVGAVRREFPTARLWVDANQAYAPRASRSIAEWMHRFEVEQVEQPFAERAIAAHARLQQGQSFRVCLDESVVDRASLNDALERRALRSLNVKPGRVGGLWQASSLARVARQRRVHAWVGGMLETGVGRAANLALASVQTFDLPGDISASARYYRNDVIRDPFVLGPGSTLPVPEGPGLGVEIEPTVYRRALVRRTRRTR